MTCRICLDDGDLIRPCNCTGTAANVHEECLLKWLTSSGRTDCEICKYEYLYREVEENECVICPKVSCGHHSGFMFCFLFFIVPVVAIISDLGPEDMFFACNLFYWCIVLYDRDEELAVQRSVLWKVGLCAGQAVIAYKHNFWFYFEIEAFLTVLLTFIVYIYLCCMQGKQVVRYIYTKENT